jgi:hypothetical protein
MFAFILMPVKMFDRESAEMYIKFEMYFLPKLAFGLITTPEQFEVAMTDFLNTLPDDEF